MPGHRKYLLFIAGVSGALLGAAPSMPPDPLPDLVEKIGPGVVNISTVTVVNATPPGMEEFFRFWGVPTERHRGSRGSGFVIDKEGYVLTNNHVVADADEVIVTLVDKREFRAKLIGKDPKLDVSLLQIRDKNKKIPPLSPVQLGDSDRARIGQSVIAIGNPFGLQNTVTRGIVSAKHRSIGIGPLDNFLQTDASINPGNSGGPLFDMAGEVIGINSVIYSSTGQSSGLGFATPINEVKSALADLKRYGRIPRPWRGILGERMTRQIMEHYELHRHDGVLLYNLVADGPAENAGLRPGDILVKIEDVKVDDPSDLERELLKHKPNDKTTLQIQRGRKVMEVPLTLPELPGKLDSLPKGII